MLEKREEGEAATARRSRPCLTCTRGFAPLCCSVHFAGKRMTLADWSDCPRCKFPCCARQFVRILATERRCPMCNEEVMVDGVKKVNDPIGTIRKRAEVVAGLASAAAMGGA